MTATWWPVRSWVVEKGLEIGPLAQVSGVGMDGWVQAGSRGTTPEWLPVPATSPPHPQGVASLG